LRALIHTCFLHEGQLYSLVLLYLTYLFLFFFFNDTATTEIYTLSLHDALPIYEKSPIHFIRDRPFAHRSADVSNDPVCIPTNRRDRKSTRLNSSHLVISYAVFCLKKKKIDQFRVVREHRERSYLRATIEILH